MKIRCTYVDAILVFVVEGLTCLNETEFSQDLNYTRKCKCCLIETHWFVICSFVIHSQIFIVTAANVIFHIKSGGFFSFYLISVVRSYSKRARRPKLLELKMNLCFCLFTQNIFTLSHLT